MKRIIDPENILKSEFSVRFGFNVSYKSGLNKTSNFAAGGYLTPKP